MITKRQEKTMGRWHRREIEEAFDRYQAAALDKEKGWVICEVLNRMEA